MGATARGRGRGCSGQDGSGRSALRRRRPRGPIDTSRMSTERPGRRRAPRRRAREGGSPAGTLGEARSCGCESGGTAAVSARSRPPTGKPGTCERQVPDPWWLGPSSPVPRAIERDRRPRRAARCRAAPWARFRKVAEETRACARRGEPCGGVQRSCSAAMPTSSTRSGISCCIGVRPAGPIIAALRAITRHGGGAHGRAEQSQVCGEAARPPPRGEGPGGVPVATASDSARASPHPCG